MTKREPGDVLIESEETTETRASTWGSQTDSGS